MTKNCNKIADTVNAIISTTASNSLNSFLLDAIILVYIGRRRSVAKKLYVPIYGLFKPRISLINFSISRRLIVGVNLEQVKRNAAWTKTMNINLQVSVVKQGVLCDIFGIYFQQIVLVKYFTVNEVSEAIVYNKHDIYKRVVYMLFYCHKLATAIHKSFKLIYQMAQYIVRAWQ